MNVKAAEQVMAKYERHQRCNLCNVPIFRKPCSNIRSSGVFHGKGNVLCNKCVAILQNVPTEQANHALNNAFEIYRKAKE